MVILHQFDISPFCIKLRRILQYKQAPFECRDYPLAANRQIRRFNPTGKLPALEHAGHWVGDSTDIAHYLEKVFPSPALIPVEPELRAMCHIIEDWADESLYFYEMRLRFTFASSRDRNLPRMLAHDQGLARWFLSRAIPGALKKILAQQGVGRKSDAQIMEDVERHLDAVEGLLQDKTWLLPGDTPTLADFAVHPMLECFIDADEGRLAIERRPVIRDWMTRLEDRAPDPSPARPLE